MTKSLFYNTLVISIVLQAMSWIIDITAFFVKVPTSSILLKQLLTIELIVQIFEAMFYVWLIYNFTKKTNVTPSRYIDWCITTPSMLITLIAYLIYVNRDKTAQLDIFRIGKENLTNFIIVLGLNWVMLLFGYLGEMRLIPVVVGVLLGFIPFIVYYYIIYVNYVGEKGQYLFWYFFCCWSFYGVAALMPYYIKNSFYNILDLFAKNFFSLFLSYVILTGKEETIFSA